MVRVRVKAGVITKCVAKPEQLSSVIGGNIRYVCHEARLTCDRTFP